MPSTVMYDGIKAGFTLKRVGTVAMVPLGSSLSVVSRLLVSDVVQIDHRREFDVGREVAADLDGGHETRAGRQRIRCPRHGQQRRVRIDLLLGDR